MPLAHLSTYYLLLFVKLLSDMQKYKKRLEAFTNNFPSGSYLHVNGVNLKKYMS